MPGYTITYFYLRGRAEPFRLLLSDQGQPWTEDVVSARSWLQGQYDKTPLLFGQLPRLRDGDFALFQTSAILRYLGRKHDLCGSNMQEAAHIDMVTDGVEDVRVKYSKLLYENYEEGREDYCKNLPNLLKPFESLLSKNNTGAGFIVGPKISFADYTLLSLLLDHLELDQCCLQSLPLLEAYVQRMCARPQIAAYLKTEEYKKRPVKVNLDE
ncbi:glutathione S-transferase P-like [Pleurodeles waltl]|uniref:glutathione S-transferase P-like n=1 Tax=Pleurodeles waltl TaxID=8319 RepID=UPI0037093BD7